ncbi:hypothetical protein C8R34_102179 [Nitrosomonas sp. Nm84]|nr:hypothetical protein C8R34_102179 [Nitrosomonas sp. Nm84]
MFTYLISFFKLFSLGILNWLYAHAVKQRYHITQNSVTNNQVLMKDNYSIPPLHPSYGRIAPSLFLIYIHNT